MTPRSRAPAATSAAGWSVPTSWLASWTDTSAVSGRIASSTSSASKRPVRSTPTAVTSVLGTRAHASSTAECSTAVVTTCRAAVTRERTPDRGVDRLGTARREHHLARSRAEERGDGLPRLFDRDPRARDLRRADGPDRRGARGGTAASRRAPRDGAARTTRGRGRRGARRARARRSGRRRRAGSTRTGATSRRRDRRACRGSSRGRARTRRAGSAARSRRTGNTPTRSRGSRRALRCARRTRGR